MTLEIVCMNVSFDTKYSDTFVSAEKSIELPIRPLYIYLNDFMCISAIF